MDAAPFLPAFASSALRFDLKLSATRILPSGMRGKRLPSGGIRGEEVRGGGVLSVGIREGGSKGGAV